MLVERSRKRQQEQEARYGVYAETREQLKNLKGATVRATGIARIRGYNQNKQTVTFILKDVLINESIHVSHVRLILPLSDKKSLTALKKAHYSGEKLTMKARVFPYKRITGLRAYGLQTPRELKMYSTFLDERAQ